MLRPLHQTALALALLATGTLLAGNASEPQSTPPARASDGIETKTPTAPPPSKAETDRAGLLMHCPKPNVAGFIGDPYPLDTCLVAGEKLGEKAVTVVLKDQRDPLQEGRQLKFCCQDCVVKFEANPRDYLAKLDEAIIAKQRSTYPLTRCMVMLDDAIDADAKALVYGNRCYLTCCAKCVNNFKKNTARYVTAYEKAVTGKQRQSYPLDTCVVAGEKLGEKVTELVIGQQLVRVCCEDCAKKVLLDPAPYLAKLTSGSSTTPSTPANGRGTSERP
jgi:YHS domain-containing protein